MLRNVKNDIKIFLSAKFPLSAIEFVKVISNKPFFLLKSVYPGLKLLEKNNKGTLMCAKKIKVTGRTVIFFK